MYGHYTSIYADMPLIFIAVIIICQQQDLPRIILHAYRMGMRPAEYVFIECAITTTKLHWRPWEMFKPALQEEGMRSCSLLKQVRLSIVCACTRDTNNNNNNNNNINNNNNNPIYNSSNRGTTDRPTKGTDRPQAHRSSCHIAHPRRRRDWAGWGQGWGRGGCRDRLLSCANND